MKDLISERPNVTPVGLGNSESAIDLAGYEGGYKTDDDVSKPVTDEDDDEDDDAACDADTAEEDNDDDAEDDDDGITIPRKRRAGSGSSAKKNKMTPAQKAKASKSDIHRSKKMKPLERFADMASAEEVTNQKNLDLKKLQSRANMAKIKAKADIQIQRDKLKAELRMLEKKQEHDFRMAQLKLQLTQRAGAPASGSLSAGFYGASAASPHPSQAGVTGLFDSGECSPSMRSFSTGPSSAFDFDRESFSYDTPLSSSAHLPTLPLPPPPEKMD
jgi:hypothetical protein